MNLEEVLAQLPAFSVAERQELVRRALELDAPGLSAEDEILVEQRLADHLQKPSSALDLKTIKADLRARLS